MALTFSRAASAADTFPVRIASLPPSGIASRALTARFTTTCSNWFTSAFTNQRSRPWLRSSADALAEKALEQHGEIVELIVEVEHLRPQGLAAGEGQKLPHQARGPVGVLLDLHDVLEGRIGRAVVGEQQVAVADDRLQHIVEVVRHAAGELADRVHLLRLGELLLHLTEVGGVEGVEDRRLAVRAGIADRRHPDPDGAGILARGLQFERRDVALASPPPP